MKLRVAGRVLVRGEWRDFEKPVLEARLIRGVIVVLFDDAAFPRGRPAPNLSAFGKDGSHLWTASNPIGGDSDAYVEILSESPLRVANFAGYVCTIDLPSGRVLRSQFTK
jgi:hypothetical protein